MGIFGELEFDTSSEQWIGQNDTHELHVAEEAMIEAYHICTMRGMSRTRYYSWLHDVDTWLADDTLRHLEGVEVTTLADTMERDLS